MMTQENKQHMLSALNRAKADIASLTDWLQCELDKKPEDKATWATVGTLEHVRDNLLDTLEYFSGIERDEIKRSLDELHS